MTTKQDTKTASIHYETDGYYITHAVTDKRGQHRIQPQYR